jgi:hypothetical protein
MTLEEFEILLDKYITAEFEEGAGSSRAITQAYYQALLEAFRAEKARGDAAEEMCQKALDDFKALYDSWRDQDENFASHRSAALKEAEDEIRRIGGAWHGQNISSDNIAYECLKAVQALGTESPKMLTNMKARIAELEQRLAAAAPSVPEDLRKASKAATGGEWSDDSSKDEYGVLCYFIESNGSKLFDTFNSDAIEVHEEYDEDGRTQWDETGRRNAKLIVTTVNWLRTLIAAQPAPAQETGTPGDSHE